MLYVTVQPVWTFIFLALLDVATLNMTEKKTTLQTAITIASLNQELLEVLQEILFLQHSTCSFTLHHTQSKITEQILKIGKCGFLVSLVTHSIFGHW